MANYTEIWDTIKYLIKTINGSKADEYDKDFMKIKINLYDNLPLRRRYYLQGFLGECLYEV